MSNWRPDNWETEKVKGSPGHCFAPQACADHFFEAGADAMLEAIREDYFAKLGVDIALLMRGVYIILPV